MRSSQRPTEPSAAPPEDAASGVEKFTPSLQFANTAVGDTALALSPSVSFSGQRQGPRDPAHESSPAPPLAGEFGPYRIIRQVGAGGMGAVYEAIDGRSGARLAIKSLLRM